jgi:hypothetical protein
MSSLVAVRRSLSPGAVFFRQVGNHVEYSLDSVKWMHAFTLPRSASPITNEVFETLIDNTIQEFIELNAGIYNSVNVITTVNIDQIAAQAGRIERNLCSAAKVLAAVSATLINEVKSQQGADEMRWDNARARLQSGMSNAAADIWEWAEPLGGLIGGLVVAVGVAMRNVADVTDYILAFDDVPDLLDAEDIDVLACYIFRAAQANPNIGFDGLRLALNSLQLSDLPSLPSGTDTAFRYVMDTYPELYSHFLAMTLDMDTVSCNCGGCTQLIPWDASITQGEAYKLLNGTVKTTPDNTAYGGNFKGMNLAFDNLQVAAQIDKVVLNFVTTEYQKSSALGWSLTPITVQLGALSGAPASQLKTITEVSPTIISTTRRVGGVQRFEFDFSSVTLTGGSNGIITITKRTAYSSPGLGADSVFTGGIVCYRTP